MARNVAAVRGVTLTDGRSLCVRQWQGPDDPTIVFLHGMLDSSEGWTTVCDALECRMVAFDLPGFGYSDPARRGSIAGYAQDVAEGLEALGIQEFALVGHSLGGAVAAALAECLGSRVSALVLLAPAGFGRIVLAEAITLPGVRQVVEAALPFALSSGLAVSVGYRTMVTNGAPPERTLVERITGRGSALIDGAREGTRAVVEAGRGRDAFHRRRLDYGGPVFAVWGEEDRLVPPDHRHGLRRAYPQAQIELWRGMGHHPLRERFDELISLIRRATPPAPYPRVDAAPGARAA